MRYSASDLARRRIPFMVRLLVVFGWIGLLLVARHGSWYSAVEIKTGRSIAEPPPQSTDVDNGLVYSAILGLCLAVAAAWWPNARRWTRPVEWLAVYVAVDLLWVSNAIAA